MQPRSILSRQPFSRTLSRGRRRASALAETIVDDAVADLVQGIEHATAPLIERATGRSRRRQHRGRTLALAACALALGAGVAYLLWRRRDQQPAYLVEEPERPHVAPAGSPPPAAGPTGPGAPERRTEPPLTAEPVYAGGERELPDTRAGAGQRDPRDPRAHDAGPALPSTVARAPFAASKDQLPHVARPALPR